MDCTPIPRAAHRAAHRVTGRAWPRHHALAALVGAIAGCGCTTLARWLHQPVPAAAPPLPPEAIPLFPPAADPFDPAWYPLLGEITYGELVPVHVVPEPDTVALLIAAVLALALARGLLAAIVLSLSQGPRR